MEFIKNIILDAGSDYLPVLPGAVCKAISIVIDYNKRKAEENMQIFLEELYQNKDKFNKDIKDDEYNQYKNNYINMLLDFVIKEKEKNKIKYLAKATCYITNVKDLREDMLLSYLDLLAELRCIDIAILFLLNDIDTKLSDYDSDEKKQKYKDKEIKRFIKESNLDNESFDYVEQKLKAKGLVNNHDGGGLLLEGTDTITSLSDYGRKFIEILKVR